MTQTMVYCGFVKISACMRLLATLVLYHSSQCVVPLHLQLASVKVLDFGKCLAFTLTTHMALTVLVTIQLTFYARATGTGTGIAWVRVWAWPEDSYRRRMDTALRGMVQLRSTPLCGISH